MQLPNLSEKLANWFTITPLGQNAWLYVSPSAKLAEGDVLLTGTPASPSAYGVVSAPYRLPAGARVAAAGRVGKGGLTLGLLNEKGEWAATQSIPPGSFRQAIAAPQGWHLPGCSGLQPALV